MAPDISTSISTSIFWATWIGAAATVCSITSFAPQTWKVIRQRRTHDLSVGIYAITVIGFAVWTACGITLGQWPLILSNAICLALSGFILLMTLLPRSEKERVAKSLDPTR
jgi:MtN3 and saliva related transmembrane protein